MNRTNTVTLSSHDRRSGLLRAAFLIFLMTGLGSWLILLSVGPTPSLERPYLLPWTILMSLLVVAPFGFAITRRQLRLYNPVLYFALIFFLPVFVLGGAQLVLGANYFWVLSLVPDQDYFLPLTILYCAIGFVSLWWAFAWQGGQRVGQALSRRLPKWDWVTEDIVKPALVILLTGEVLRLAALAIGMTGYNLLATVPAFGTVLVSFAGLGTWSAFVLWLVVFRQPKLRLSHGLLAAFLTVVIVYNQLVNGGRGALFNGLVMIALAYLMSGRPIRLRVAAIIGVLAVVVLLAGMIYGTAFRSTKGAEAAASLDDYVYAVDSTFRVLDNQSSQNYLAMGFDNLIQRVEIISQMSVLVANHERLRPLEEQYGLANNIWTYTWTAFVPRFLWKDKPLISDSRAVAALYFGVDYNSFVQTPMVDLLRNYGPIGIPLGMALLGIVLRIMFSTLVEQTPIPVGRAAMYYVLLTSISFEGFYGTILPGLLRTGLVAAIGSGLLSVSMRLFSRKT